MKFPDRPSILSSFLLLEGVLLYFLGRLLGFRGLLLALLASAALGITFCLKPAWPLKILSKSLRRSYLPQGEAALYESLAWVVSGILLILPGVLSDLLAFLIVLPLTRRRVLAGLFSRLFPGNLSFFGEMTWRDWLSGSQGGPKPPPPSQDKVGERIRDAEFEVLPDKEPPPKR